MWTPIFRKIDNNTDTNIGLANIATLTEKWGRLKILQVKQKWVNFEVGLDYDLMLLKITAISKNSWSVL